MLGRTIVPYTVREEKRMSNQIVVPPNDPDVAVVDRVIRSRRTTKLLLSPEHRDARERAWGDRHRRELATMIEGAAWAPFHRRANEEIHRTAELSAPMPWRFYVVEGWACSSLITWLERQADSHPDSKWSRAWQSKIKDMLAACGALVQATWLPDPAEGRDAASGELAPAEPTMTTNNIEHVAAAAAAVQNLLLAAEVRGWRSYWSSGGILRDPGVLERLGAGPREAPLGSLFLSPDVAERATAREGGLRDERGETHDWVRWVEFGTPSVG